MVKQGVETKACQFSWWCDGRPDQVEEAQRYAVAKEIARKALNQQLKDPTGGALYFHDRTVHPDWAKAYRKTAQTTHFLFYSRTRRWPGDAYTAERASSIRMISNSSHFSGDHWSTPSYAASSDCRRRHCFTPARAKSPRLV